MPRGYPETTTCEFCKAGWPADFAYCPDCGAPMPMTKRFLKKNPSRPENSEKKADHDYNSGQHGYRGRLYDGYDYDNQAWVQNGVYVRCGHPDAMGCRCYGKLHEGEPSRAIKEFKE